MKRVSVVILNWNGVDMLRKFIPSVMDNSVGEGIEICVADNASSDGSLEMLRSEFPVVRLIELDQNYGFAEGYNRALEQVDAEYVVLLPSGEVTSYVVVPALPLTNVVATSSFIHILDDGVNTVLLGVSLNVKLPTVNVFVFTVSVLLALFPALSVTVVITV